MGFSLDFDGRLSPYGYRHSYDLGEFFDVQRKDPSLHIRAEVENLNVQFCRFT